MFNDVEKLSPWPARLYIKKVSKITLYTGCAVVNGIEIHYDMSNNSDPKIVVHGKKEGQVNERILTDDEFFTGFFGSTDNKEPGTLRRVGFLVYNKVTGDITPFENKAPSLILALKSSLIKSGASARLD
ncbi:hypothetical protein C0992_003166 [Termitomyces sp. T32_za158]|nr:hypothetical protein C0992_003166 [Termitomyces sp. T32_za158]